MVVGKLHGYMSKNESSTFSNIIHKINSKCIKDLNINLLEENTGTTFFNINCSDIFFDPPSRIKIMKAKVNKWDPIKL